LARLRRRARRRHALARGHREGGALCVRGSQRLHRQQRLGPRRALPCGDPLAAGVRHPQRVPRRHARIFTVAGALWGGFGHPHRDSGRNWRGHAHEQPLAARVPHRAALAAGHWIARAGHDFGLALPSCICGAAFGLALRVAARIAVAHEQHHGVGVACCERVARHFLAGALAQRHAVARSIAARAHRAADAVGRTHAHRQGKRVRNRVACALGKQGVALDYALAAALAVVRVLGERLPLCGAQPHARQVHCGALPGAHFNANAQRLAHALRAAVALARCLRVGGRDGHGHRNGVAVRARVPLRDSVCLCDSLEHGTRVGLPAHHRRRNDDRNRNRDEVHKDDTVGHRVRAPHGLRDRQRDGQRTCHRDGVDNGGVVGNRCSDRDGVSHHHQDGNCVIYANGVFDNGRDRHSRGDGDEVCWGVKDSHHCNDRDVVFRRYEIRHRVGVCHKNGHRHRLGVEVRGHHKDGHGVIYANGVFVNGRDRHSRGDGDEVCWGVKDGHRCNDSDGVSRRFEIRHRVGIVHENGFRHRLDVEVRGRHKDGNGVIYANGVFVNGRDRHSCGDGDEVCWGVKDGHRCNNSDGVFRRFEIRHRVGVCNENGHRHRLGVEVCGYHKDGHGVVYANGVFVNGRDRYSCGDGDEVCWGVKDGHRCNDSDGVSRRFEIRHRVGIVHENGFRHCLDVEVRGRHKDGNGVIYANSIVVNGRYRNSCGDGDEVCWGVNDGLRCNYGVEVFRRFEIRYRVGVCHGNGHRNRLGVEVRGHHKDGHGVINANGIFVNGRDRHGRGDGDEVCWGVKDGHRCNISDRVSRRFEIRHCVGFCHGNGHRHRLGVEVCRHHKDGHGVIYANGVFVNRCDRHSCVDGDKVCWGVNDGHCCNDRDEVFWRVEIRHCVGVFHENGHRHRLGVEVRGHNKDGNGVIYANGIFINGRDRHSRGNGDEIFWGVNDGHCSNDRDEIFRRFEIRHCVGVCHGNGHRSRLGVEVCGYHKDGHGVIYANGVFVNGRDRHSRGDGDEVCWGVNDGHRCNIRDRVSRRFEIRNCVGVCHGNGHRNRLVVEVRCHHKDGHGVVYANGIVVNGRDRHSCVDGDEVCWGVNDGNRCNDGDEVFRRFEIRHRVGVCHKNGHRHRLGVEVRGHHKDGHGVIYANGVFVNGRDRHSRGDGDKVCWGVNDGHCCNDRDEVFWRVEIRHRVGVFHENGNRHRLGVEVRGHHKDGHGVIYANGIFVNGRDRHSRGDGDEVYWGITDGHRCNISDRVSRRFEIRHNVGFCHGNGNRHHLSVKVRGRNKDGHGVIYSNGVFVNGRDRHSCGDGDEVSWGVNDGHRCNDRDEIFRRFEIRYRVGVCHKNGHRHRLGVEVRGHHKDGHGVIYAIGVFVIGRDRHSRGDGDEVCWGVNDGHRCNVRDEVFRRFEIRHRVGVFHENGNRHRLGVEVRGRHMDGHGVFFANGVFVNGRDRHSRVNGDEVCWGVKDGHRCNVRDEVFRRFEIRHCVSFCHGNGHRNRLGVEVCGYHKDGHGVIYANGVFVNGCDRHSRGDGDEVCWVVDDGHRCNDRDEVSRRFDFRHRVGVCHGNGHRYRLG
jgi:hypothetical protein